MPTVLVVDDDSLIRQLVQAVLEEEGYEVRVAEDGFAALRQVEAVRPECVVLDVTMPGLDGHAVLQAIRAGECGLDLPVVMLTAAADDVQAWRAWAGGVDYFLAKPFDSAELLRYLDSLFAEDDSAAPARWLPPATAHQ